MLALRPLPLSQLCYKSGCASPLHQQSDIVKVDTPNQQQLVVGPHLYLMSATELAAPCSSHSQSHSHRQIQCSKIWQHDHATFTTHTADFDLLQLSVDSLPPLSWRQQGRHDAECQHALSHKGLVMMNWCRRINTHPICRLKPAAEACSSASSSALSLAAVTAAAAAAAAWCFWREAISLTLTQDW